jgi:uncharacterized repeat protein (TIGR01451 family)
MRFRLAPFAASAATVLALATGVVPAAAGLQYDVGIQKSHTGNFTVGQNGTFTITLSNAAGASVSSTGNTVVFTVTDTLPAGLTYQSFAAGTSAFTCSASGQVVTCTGTPNLSPGASTSFTITVAVGAQAAPSVSNTASWTDNCGAGCDSSPNDHSSTDPVTVNLAPSASPSPSPRPSPSPSPSPTAVALPAAGTGAGSGTGAPAALLAFLTVIVVGGIATLIRTRTARPRS